MKLNFPVLLKDDSWEVLQEKSVEESFELFVAIEGVIDNANIKKEHLLHIAEEALDNIQIGIGVLDKLEQEHKGIIEKANLEHVKKLASRGWNFKTVLECRED